MNKPITATELDEYFANMKTVTCKGKSTMEVLHELTALDKQERIALISWNGGTCAQQVKDHIYEMIGVLKEDEFA